MQGMTIFEAMLTAAAPVTALVGARIYPLELPPGTPITALPAIVIRGAGADSGLPTIDAAASYQIRLVDIELHLMAKNIVQLFALQQAVTAACDFQRGTFAGLFVVSVQPGRIGQTDTDSALGVFYVPVTFSLTYRR